MRTLVTIHGGNGETWGRYVWTDVLETVSFVPPKKQSGIRLYGRARTYAEAMRLVGRNIRTEYGGVAS